MHGLGHNVSRDRQISIGVMPRSLRQVLHSYFQTKSHLILPRLVHGGVPASDVNDEVRQ